VKKKEIDGEEWRFVEIDGLKKRLIVIY